MNNDIFTSSYVIVEELLKKSPYESTEIVYLSLPDGSRQGPYIRKVFDKSSGLGNTYKQLFNQSKTNHPQIPNIYSVFDDRNNLVVFEQYICGQTLDKFLSNINFSADILSKIFLDLCQAADYLHTNFGAPIIHRDIKPSNILIDKEGQLKLIDFGISRNFENSDNPDTHKFGTVGYAPPEQFGYKQTDVRSDIYSLGKVLEFLCKRSNWACQDKKITDNIFKEVINKACEFDPNFRYKNVGQLISDFKKIKKTSSNKTLIVAGHV